MRAYLYVRMLYVHVPMVSRHTDQGRLGDPDLDEKVRGGRAQLLACVPNLPTDR